MICPKCGYQILEDANFCRNCGAALHARDENARTGQGEKKRKQGLFHQPAVVLAGVAVLLLVVSGGVFGYYGLQNENGMTFLIKNKDDQNQRDEEPGKQGEEDSDGKGQEEEGSGGREQRKADSGGEEQGEGDLGSENPKEESKDSTRSGDIQSETALANTWQQKDNRWYYYDEKGEMLTNAWVGNYYVGMDGVMQVSTLTPDGYWLDETGLASEDKRIYGECVFHPTGYRKDGNGFLITGDICDTGYASEEYLRSLQVGDVILRPADDAPIGACVFDTESAVTEVMDYPGYYYDANGEYHEDGTTKRAVCTQSTAPPEDYYGDQYYTFGSDFMTWWQYSSMDAPLYRVIDKDVVLIFNENADFVPANPDWEGIPQSMSEFLERENRGRGVLKVKVIDGRIIQAVDMGNNYAG